MGWDELGGGKSRGGGRPWHDLVVGGRGLRASSAARASRCGRLAQPLQLPLGATEGGSDAAGDRGVCQAPTVEVVQEVLGVGHGGGEPGAAVTIDVTIQLTEANGMVNSRNFQSFNGIYL